MTPISPGSRAATLARWRSRNIGFIFQLYNLIPVLTAHQNVELPLLLVPMSGRERKERRARRSSWSGSAIGSSTIRASSRAARNSAWRSRARWSAIPRCCSPTSRPATSTRQSADEILGLLERLNKEFGKTIVMVTHDPHAAERAKRVVQLDKGVLTQ